MYIIVPDILSPDAKGPEDEAAVKGKPYSFKVPEASKTLKNTLEPITEPELKWVINPPVPSALLKSCTVPYLPLVA